MASHIPGGAMALVAGDMDSKSPMGVSTNMSQEYSSIHLNC